MEKTEEIPFFIEDFIRSIKDVKIIEKKNDTCYLKRNTDSMTIPSRIQDVIMDRVEEALLLLSAIYGWFTEGFDTADLRDAKGLLDELPFFNMLMFSCPNPNSRYFKKSTPHYAVSGLFWVELWIGHGQIYKISALQKLGISCLYRIFNGIHEIKDKQTEG
jgi:hypothetical protein